MASDGDSFSFPTDIPSIIVPPLNQTVPQGTRVELTCTVFGGPPADVNWVFRSEDGAEELITVDTPGTQMGIMGNEVVLTHTLVLLDIPLSRAGQYECVANNILGNDTAQASVTVFGETTLPEREAVFFDTCISMQWSQCSC